MEPSKSLYRTLQELHEAGHSLTSIIYAMQAQLAALEKDLPPSSASRYLVVARTNIEISYFYLERYERETATRVPLVPVQ